MRSFDSSCMSMAFGSHGFFGQDLVPHIEKVGHRLIDTATPYEQRDALEYLYVYEGRGAVDIDGVRRPLRRGSCMVLSNFQLRRFLPQADQPLKVDYCRLKDGSMYVLWSCPYYQPPDFQTSPIQTTQIQQFDESRMDAMERIWRDMYQCQFSADRFAKERQLYLFMEYLGWFHRLCYGGK